MVLFLTKDERTMQNDNEIWKPVQGYEGLYEVSSLGRIKSLERYIEQVQNGVLCKRPQKERILKLANFKGYFSVNLTLNGFQKLYLVHRLVAKAFIPNPENKKEVNHLNGIRNDNQIENLEWATRSENSQHAYDTGLRKKYYNSENKSSVAISQFTLGGQWICDWAGALHAQKELGIDSCHISKCINGKRATTGGYIWKKKDVTTQSNGI